jgi:sugar transferase (PEP-CTERM/EpsH1 system associated)
MRDGRPIKVLYFAPSSCWPQNTGAKLRNYHLARELSRSARVTYLSFADEAAAGMNGQFESIMVPREPGYTLAKIARGAMGNMPLSVLNYTSRAMKHVLSRLLKERRFDVIQVEGIHLAAYVPALLEAPDRPVMICDWHNIESELMLRYSSHAPDPARKLYARLTARKLSKLEQHMLNQFDAHLAVSHRDRSRLTEMNRSARIFVIENGVDVSRFSDEELERARAKWLGAPAARNRLLLVGSMDYHANIDGAIYFARSIWPEVRRAWPKLIFTIVGRNPTAEVTALGRMIPGVEVTGTVEDVRPYYREALAAVVPLRIGGGSRLKILEAMAAGVPVISTRLGAEGLEIKSGEHFLLADSQADMCRAIAALSQDAQLRRRLAVAGRQLVRARYDWSALGSALASIYADLIKERTP